MHSQRVKQSMVNHAVIAVITITFVNGQIVCPRLSIAEDGIAIHTDIEKDVEFLKPLVNQELSFIHFVCSPNEVQMKRIVSVAKTRWLEMRKYIDNGQNVVWQANRQMFFGPNRERLRINPFKQIRHDAAVYLKEILDAEQYDTYVRESAARELFERKAGVWFVLDRLQERLVLSQEQRDDLSKRLMEDWPSIDIMTLQVYQVNPQYIPTLPSDLLTPSLNPVQRDILKSIESQTVALGTNLQTTDSDDSQTSWIP